MVKKFKIAIIVGTRPEIIKMSPVIKECKRRGIKFFILHTNQHYSKNLDQIFFKELGLPKPKYNLNAGSGAHGKELSKMVLLVKKVLIKEKPSIVFVEGDTNTVLAGALAASKLKIKIGHIEAGLRSYLKEMPEEINRILADRCSDLLFAPTKESKETLIKEGFEADSIFITGNTVVDAIFQNKNIAKKKSKILEQLDLKKKQYFLLTLHRQENVDNKKRLVKILKALELVFKDFKTPIIFPIHPRTEKNISRFGLKMPNGIILIKPIGYFDFLFLEMNARLILTDSGGIQEEACVLKVPCITLRENTERPETVAVGANILPNKKLSDLVEICKKMMDRQTSWSNPFGGGKTAEKILKITMQNYGR